MNVDEMRRIPDKHTCRAWVALMVIARETAKSKGFPPGQNTLLGKDDTGVNLLDHCWRELGLDMIYVKAFAHAPQLHKAVTVLRQAGYLYKPQNWQHRRDKGGRIVPRLRYDVTRKGLALAEELQAGPGTWPDKVE